MLDEQKETAFAVVSHGFGTMSRNELVRPGLFEIACGADLEVQTLEGRDNTPTRVRGTDIATEDCLEQFPR
jgi:hypothetical protein